MRRVDLEEMAALYALGLLDGEDLRAFEKELRSGNPDAVRLLGEYGGAADMIALTADPVEPPPELEARVLESLPSQEPRIRVVPQPRMSDTVVPMSRPRNTALPWGIAALLAIACAYQWMDRSETEAALAQSQERIRFLEQESALDSLRIAVLKSRLENAPTAQAVAVWDGARQEGRLRVSNLPAVPQGKEYQLWLIDAAYEAPVSAGVFNTDELGNQTFAFAGSANVDSINAFALSVEDAGGKPSPEGPIVLMTE